MKKTAMAVMSLILCVCMMSPASAGTAYVNTTLTEWSAAFKYFANLLTQNDGISDSADIPFTSGRIVADEDSFTEGYSGVRVAHGGMYSPNGTVTLGCGTGVVYVNKDMNYFADDDYWYVSLTYSPEASNKTVNVTGMAFVLACIKVGLPIPTDDTMLQRVAEMLDLLFAYDNIALQMGDLVLVHKLLPGDQHLLAVDTVLYYDEFYYNDTENYFIMD